MNTELIIVFRGNPVDAEIVKDILEENGVKANIKNQLMGTIAPWHVSGGGIDPVEIEVLADDVEQALKLINAFKKRD